MQIFHLVKAPASLMPCHLQLPMGNYLQDSLVNFTPTLSSLYMSAVICTLVTATVCLFLISTIARILSCVSTACEE